MKFRFPAAALFAAVSTAGLSHAEEPSLAPEQPAPLSERLPVRPTRPLALAEAEVGVPLGYKVFFLGIVAGAAGFVWYKRKNPMTGASRIPTLRIAGRAAVGVRSELIVVEVEGQNLLLGVTPHGISRLAVLPQTEAQELALATELPGEAAEVDLAQDSGAFSRALDTELAVGRVARHSDVRALTNTLTNTLPNTDTVSRIDALAKRARAVEDVRDVVEEQARGLVRGRERH